jgi:hypothetical protein
VELKNLFIEPTAKTPQVDLNYPSGELIMSGKSIPENAAIIYEAILKWVTEYIKNPRPTTNLRLNLEYFNTASAIWLAKIVQTLGSIKDSEYTLMIHLYFNIEDYDNMEAEDLKDELHPIIHMIGVPTVSIGIKIYGTDDKGEIIKESMVLIYLPLPNFYRQTIISSIFWHNFIRQLIVIVMQTVFIVLLSILTIMETFSQKYNN